MRVPTVRLTALIAAAAAATVALTAAAMVYPPLALLAVAGLCVPLAPRIARRSAQLAVLLLLGSPLLLSTFKLGGLTLDNAATLIGLCLVLVWLFGRRQIKGSAFSVFPFLVAIAVAVSAGFNGIDSLPGVIRFLGIAFIPMLVEDDRISMAWVRNLLVTIISIGALSVLLQPLIKFPAPYFDYETGVIRFGGLMGHPNFAAYAFMLTVVFLLSRRALHWFEWAAIALMVAAIAATGSLGALAATAAGVAMVFARSFRRVISVLVVAIAAVVLLGEPIRERLTAFQSADSENSLTWRARQWESTLELVRGREGSGIGWQQVTENSGNGLGAHSAYVQIYVELGLLGLILAAVGVGAWVIAMQPRYVSAVLLGVTIVTSATDPVVLYPSTLSILVLLLAALRKERVEKRSTRVAASHATSQAATGFPYSAQTADRRRALDANPAASIQPGGVG